MKLKLRLLVLLLPSISFASAVEEACRAKGNRRLEMNLISSNLANVTVTRTPEGEPYRRKDLVCVGQICNVKETLKVKLQHEPGHPHANENGDVSYPDISVMQEMESMIQATRNYEEAAQLCR